MSVGYEEVVRFVRSFADVIAENKAFLTELDSAIGDADHGINMDRGMQAVLGRLDAQAADDIGALFKTIGMTLVSTVGGAGHAGGSGGGGVGRGGVGGSAPHPHLQVAWE
jgi:dihydroxyacetone kinase-like protein